MANRKIGRPNEERRAKQLMDRIAVRKKAATKLAYPPKKDPSHAAVPVVKEATHD